MKTYCWLEIMGVYLVNDELIYMHLKQGCSIFMLKEYSVFLIASYMA